MSSAEKGQFDILCATTEKACSFPAKFWSNMLIAGICLLAVDEAHCISEWGHDFRKEYKQLDVLHGSLGDVPFPALTATATESVKPLARNCSFLDEAIKEITKYAANSGSTVIYCTTVKEVFTSLKEAGVLLDFIIVKCLAKHVDSHRSFVQDEIQVMVATVAFGMGID